MTRRRGPRRETTARLAAPAAALIFLADGVLTGCEPPRPLAAALDEPAHLATAFLLLRALPLPADRSFLLGAALGATLIDADHLPMEAGWDLLTRGTGRPVTHSLPTIGALLLAARAARGPGRRVLVGAACGLATHLLRDLATGGVPLLWPGSKRRVRLPYGLYALLLLLPGLVALARRPPPDGARGNPLS